MNRFITVRSLILVFSLLLGIIPVSATERRLFTGTGTIQFLPDANGGNAGPFNRRVQAAS